MLRLIRQWIIDTLGFTRSEANGTLVLVVILLVSIIVPRLVLMSTNNLNKRFTVNQDKLDQWSKELEQSIKKKDSPIKVEEITTTQRFRFDPNTASKEELLSLGFAQRVANNIISYREKGGEFKIKKDLSRIYGISEALMADLWPLISLPEEYEHTKTDDIPLKKKETVTVSKFDLNHVDAATLQSIRGIGPVLSERIIKFRDRLGGFHSTSQLDEVYGLDSLVINKILEKSTLDNTVLNQINLNTDSLKALYQHPYIDYNLAKAIYNFRVQRGRLDSVAQIKSIKILNDSIYQKIYPYLSLNP
ncbi:MAG: hypothetical protein CMB80_20895 [Flammeovirgaceae bacterium]|nr:hypothetical protein [Flammeovirgaceae bacterium]MBR07070.1 hypothetical protein [Rickettsiales bacterium]